MANVEVKVFRGVGAMIAQVTNHTQVSVFAIVTDKSKLDVTATTRRFDVDLDQTPKRAKSWNDVRFDDRGVDRTGGELPASLDPLAYRLGITSIGSGVLRDLTRGPFVGALYLEDGYYTKLYPTAIALATDPKPWPPAGVQLYQLTSVAYSSDVNANGARAGKRYHGFLGKVTAVSGTMIQVSFAQPGGAPAAGPFWFNLDDPSDCDRTPPAAALAGAASITTGNANVGDEGAMFVALPTAANMLISGPKLPIGLGG